MAYRQIKDVVEQVRSIHAQLKETAESAAAPGHDDRKRLLLRYISEHQEHLERALSSLAPRGDEAVLDTWLQFSPDEEVARLVRDTRDEASGGDLDQLVQRVLQTEDALAGFYEILKGHTSAPRVQSFFASLIEMEGAARRRYALAGLESRDA